MIPLSVIYADEDSDSEWTTLSIASCPPPEVKPEIPYEVHNTTKPDPQACIDAVRVMCGGSK